MSSIILSAALFDTTAGGSEQVDLNISVNEADWAGHFDRLQVYRSTIGPAGPFEEITDANWSRPRIPKNASDAPSSPVTGPLINIVGVELGLLINDNLLIVTFTGSNPLSFAQVASQISSQSGSRLSAYIDSEGGLVIEAIQPGLASRLSIILSEGAILLGLPTMEPDSLTTGKDARPNLVLGQETYALRDYFGSRDYDYRTRFLNSTTGAQSEPSVSSSPTNAVGVSTSNVIIGFIDLVFQDGNALEGAEVHLYTDSGGSLVDGKLVTGASIVKYTDEAGHVEFQVVRGQRLTVSIQGTNHVRTFTTPTDPAIKRFNFLDPTIADQDVFTVSVPEIIAAERRTL